MGQQNDSGRNASLDDKKLRAAGRQKEQAVESLGERPEKGPVGGAFGSEPEGHTKPRSTTERTGSNLSQGGGGGGAGTGMADPKLAQPPFDDAPEPEPKSK